MFLLHHRPATHSAGVNDRDVDRPVATASVRVVASPAVDEEPARVLGDGGATDTLRELLLAVASGDQDASAALEGHIGGLVRVNVRRVLRDASRSDAVTQEFFAGVPRDVSDFDPIRDSAQVWLLTRAHLRATSGLPSGHAASC